MRARIITAVSGGILALTASAMSIPAANAGATAHPDLPICQGNTNPAYDTGTAVPAQSVPAPNAGYSTKGATLVRVSTSCVLNYVTAWGKLSGSGPVTKVNLEIKADVVGGPNGHSPGATIPGFTFNNLAAVGSAATPPYYTITAVLPTSFTLNPGTFYWVQLQVRMNPSLGNWSWEVVRPDPAGNGDLWRNPGGLVGCGTGWKRVSLPCLGGAPGKGLMTELGT